MFYLCFCCCCSGKRNVLGTVYPEGCVRAVRIGRLRSVYAVRAATLLGTIFFHIVRISSAYHTVCLSARFSPEKYPNSFECTTLYPRSLCGKSKHTTEKFDYNVLAVLFNIFFCATLCICRGALAYRIYTKLELYIVTRRCENIFGKF